MALHQLAPKSEGTHLEIIYNGPGLAPGLLSSSAFPAVIRAEEHTLAVRYGVRDSLPHASSTQSTHSACRWAQVESGRVVDGAP